MAGAATWKLMTCREVSNPGLVEPRPVEACGSLGITAVEAAKGGHRPAAALERHPFPRGGGRMGWGWPSAQDKESSTAADGD
jgi:hypothetical protein